MNPNQVGTNPSPVGLPTKEQAEQFALMLSVGAPPLEAIRYFVGAEDAPMLSDVQCLALTTRWMASKIVQGAIHRLQGKDFEAMTSLERITAAVEKQYAEMAYFLYSRNYVDLNGADKSKADTCRAALEAKLAGNAGKLSVLDTFFEDIRVGKVKLAGVPAPVSH